MKSLRQVKDLIRNRAKEDNVNAQVLLRNYMLGRLLERISLSEYKNKFILKGGMLVMAMVGENKRSTIDMDVTAKHFPVNLESIEAALKTILAVYVGDGVYMEVSKIEQTRADDEYDGFRISLNALLENTKVPIKVDITTGDKITPKEISYKYELLLEDRNINVLSYNLETVIAEKLETIITRSTANTRMRDYYDIYILLNVHGDQLDRESLADALNETAEHRGTTHVLLEGKEILLEIFQSSELLNHWTRYQKKYNYADEISWNQINITITSLWNSL
ncbi:nucleotidyl transferase AbiEii/AbiGii toxin family protein [Alkalibacterium thalassium]|uniref:Nucleotidyl transferase AbiEii toxin, Type IV TA system n=1 Tax=Alkalibacterium thalassium TaxID=426701 RepID=A0A1G9DL46_9LACT|nr:nucleotidyl transferase AbiEii/AbiGii toxin family protein [Alkalibacterium thalassium]SDK64485.1 Nucleotidyl transferase AbiEii toxin, Type IV TA system [Alkalibacterium thalassium]